MTSQLARLYVLVVGVLVFFVAWAAVAAHPWAAKPTQDPRIAALAARQQQLQIESVRVKQIVDARWATYRRALAAHHAAAASLATRPTVRVVNLPALVVTRSS
jgi:uncharacterized protein YgbK (DUF1537 family)